ncbi:formyltransferase family protein [Natronorubrum sp. A-ect3]|uniref:formyltransferase family protein n=1 Tax=Natronorubrum sp. A-ect3 TaxID=3242698 RepID=UPI00359E9268
MTDDGLTIGILLDESAMERWALEAVETAIRDAGVSVAQVILPPADSPADTDTAGSSIPWQRYAAAAREYGAWTPVLAWHQLASTPWYLEKIPLEDRAWFDDAEIVHARPEPADGIGNRLPAAAIERIESAELDLLFRRGFGIIKGDVLSAPSHGVLSYHHGNIREYRGRSPGVWEFANDERTAGVTLQRLTSTLDGGEIVVEKTIDITDCRTWQNVRQRLFDNSTDMLATACTRLEDPEFGPTHTDELGPLYTCPGLVDTVRIELKNIRGKVQNHVTE